MSIMTLSQVRLATVVFAALILPLTPIQGASPDAVVPRLTVDGGSGKNGSA